MKTEIASQIEINDLDVGTELSSDELQAIAGAVRMEPSWTSGRTKQTDEWDIVQ
ncbi:MAG TPA: hypothetical protein VIT67_09105 [Povalibacter sp.]